MAGCAGADRREDFRTEVLGLVKAQMVKNAVIVPTGSKAASTPSSCPTPPSTARRWLEEGKAAYRMFISALLDITDNRVSGTAVPPEHVVRHDGDDVYLVVAADKGTATFSDIANGVAQSYGFWLDDAFASGGWPATTIRPWASPPAVRGSRSSGTSVKWASTPSARTSPSSGSVT